MGLPHVLIRASFFGAVKHAHSCSGVLRSDDTEVIQMALADPTDARSANSRMVGEMQMGHTKRGLHQRLSPVQHPVTSDQTS
jgi:hypothetical protein